MFIKKIFFFIIIKLFSLPVCSQQENVNTIFNKIVNTIGNNFNGVPKLEIIDTENNPAYFLPNEKKIFIENKTIKLFSNDSNFNDIIAYLISHELAHHYLNHGWMKNVGFGYTSTIGNFLIDENNLNQKKIDETQADIFGGFFAKISGYDALNHGEKCLRTIYTEYNINENIRGYPSLDERVEIINSNIEKTNKLADIFYLGNLLLVIGEYEIANNCYVEILNNNFSSREIFNNIGTIHLLKSIDILNSNQSKFIFPVFIEFNTRADNRLKRNTDNQNIIEHLDRAKSYFEKSLSKDKNYKPAKINLIVVDFIEKLIKNSLNKNYYENLIKKKYIDEKRINDLMILYKIFNNKKIKLKEVCSGSQISTINYDIYSGINKKMNQMNFQIKRYEKIVNDYFLGLQKPYTRINTNGGKNRIYTKEYKGYKLIKDSKDKYIFIVNDKEYLDYISSISNDTLFSKIFDLNDKTFKKLSQNKIILQYDINETLEKVILY